ncbi:hypothetical protein CSUI_008193, partial [Cystoisospora suis]
LLLLLLLLVHDLGLDRLVEYLNFSFFSPFSLFFFLPFFFFKRKKGRRTAGRVGWTGRLYGVRCHREEIEIKGRKKKDEMKDRRKK